MKYDFGCARLKKEGYIGVDIDPHSDADIVWDLTQECPHIPSNSADEVYCSNVMEHIPHPHHYLLLKEIIRVLKPGGKFEIIVPHPGSDIAMVPDHKHWFSRRYIDDCIRPYPGVHITGISLKKTELFSFCQEKFSLDDHLVETLFRNVATEFIIMGEKVAV